MNTIDLFLVDMPGHHGRVYEEKDQIAVINCFKGRLRCIKPEQVCGLVYASDDESTLVNNGLGGLTIKITLHTVLKGSATELDKVEAVKAWKIDCRQTVR